MKTEKGWLAFVCLLGILWACADGKQEGSRPESITNTDAAVSSRTNDVSTSTKKTILFFGNSITEGVGVAPEEAFPYRIGQRLDSLGFPYQAINAGLGGETTSGGLNRLDWVLDQQPVDIFVLELGGNDGLRGINPAESKKNLQAMIDRVGKAYPEATIVLAGMESPPNLGPAYNDAFRSMFPELAYANGIPLIPFILEGVAGNPELNLPDGIHPTPHGHRLVANHVWTYLRPLLTQD
ncbi:MAG TPA: arylesterase [Cytophagales bacterium]|nr:arylesterase [Cytophagales bacterium]HAA20822.1 arylesterase [Cytophagales bacterium]HAP59110.1 arylesterase [Cytophagales bacterium]